MTDAPRPDRYELTAAVALWRGEEILVMKRAGGFSSGGWFLPGGHVEPGERPAEAAARELEEEAGIRVDPALLAIADVMTFAGDEGTAHVVIYNTICPDGAEPALNDEHTYARWMTVEGYIARFLDETMLRQRGASESAIALANEVARTVREAARARGLIGDGRVGWAAG